MRKEWGTGDKEFGNLLDKERKQGSKHIVSRFYYEIPPVLYQGYLSPIPRYPQSYTEVINLNKLSRLDNLKLGKFKK